MSLLDDITSSTRRPGSRCTVTVILTELPVDDAADLRVALANPRIPGTAISEALAKRGIELADSTIGRHRRGSCKCPR